MVRYCRGLSAGRAHFAAAKRSGQDRAANRAAIHVRAGVICGSLTRCSLRSPTISLLASLMVLYLLFQSTEAARSGADVSARSLVPETGRSGAASSIPPSSRSYRSYHSSAGSVTSTARAEIERLEEQNRMLQLRVRLSLGCRDAVFFARRHFHYHRCMTAVTRGRDAPVDEAQLNADRLAMSLHSKSQPLPLRFVPFRFAVFPTTGILEFGVVPPHPARAAACCWLLVVPVCQCALATSFPATL